MGAARCVAVFSAEELVASIDDEIRLVVCTLRFAESRTLEVLAWLRERFPHVPCVICRMTRSELSFSSLRGAYDAALSLGAAEALDFAAFAQAHGEAAAKEWLRSRLGAYLVPT